MPTVIKLILNALKVYWRTLFTIIYPIALLPVFLSNNIAELRCLYVVLLMAGYWVFEVLPLPVTSLIPMVLFPLMGILDSEATSLCYLKETNMMFIGGLIIAIAVEYCNLHTRVALYVINLVGCSPRRLNLGLVTVTMFVSMWISNTAATAMMIPIIEATLKELETQGIGEMYESNTLTLTTNENNGQIQQPQENNHNNTNNIEQSQQQTAAAAAITNRRPTKTTMCYFISTSYAASIGGMGCIVGSGTNLTFKGIYESQYPNSPGIEFIKWMLLNIPMMLLMMYLSLIWLQFWFMGLFRPNSNDSKIIKIGKQSEIVAHKLIKQKIDELGPLTFHQLSVGLLFILSVLLWFFRKPQFIAGWAELITQHKVKDATAAFIVVLLLFVIPASPSFINIFSKNESKRPKQASPALITWKIVQQKLPWGLIFLLGGGFALAEGSKQSGMSNFIAEYLQKFALLPKFVVMVISCVFATILTQFSSNVAVANVLLPVLSAMSKIAQVHPLYLMLPTSLCCSFAYCLPVSTPPNAIAAAPCNMPSNEMAKCGIGVVIISLAVLFAVFPFLAGVIWDLDTFPIWAQ